ncbi:hypothetical protein IW140_002535 [Coemansia sp. RSA 1813]|nr:hypothetical protein EV178_001894 [Coemansia sp. RSA 1646]KAJ1769639.1 hypothetical protein LPJ74_003888 [Coemansia sp. RSA 1843]KAJ2090988.1 hypothetical protein IW138_002182 [Coemansia sp. RSA 986]KAJ2215899.1 hypothetical protein EV179_001727 [Coemansia sp. RSA 487]KAJ2570259.1 hypothetical protein IW140_002535 [Coemansia sp. RSA 1813]
MRTTAAAPTEIVRRLMSTSTDGFGGSAGSGRLGSIASKRLAEEKRKQFASILNSGLTNMGAPAMGRSVAVISGGPSKAYARLNRIMTENNVRRELFLRKRYEKPKYKRQRLRFESHARRFKDEVRNKVHLVMKMKSWGI